MYKKFEAPKDFGSKQIFCPKNVGARKIFEQNVGPKNTLYVIATLALPLTKMNYVYILFASQL